MNLILIGYRGTGKTTVAQALAARLGWPWIDSDHQIERRSGKSIADIFADEGEAAFRDLEAAVLADFAQLEYTIIAVGGGAVLRPENRQRLRAAGTLVWLQAAVGTIAARLAADASTAARRPNLTPSGGTAEIEQLLQERTPIYAAEAHLTIDTEGKTPAAVAEEILAQLQLTPPGASA